MNGGGGGGGGDTGGGGGGGPAAAAGGIVGAHAGAGRLEQLLLSEALRGGETSVIRYPVVIPSQYILLYGASVSPPSQLPLA